MTIKQAYKILIEDYAYATEESKEALKVLVMGYDYLFKVTDYNFIENKKRLFKDKKASEIIQAQSDFERKYGIDTSKLSGLYEED